jgi:hypothetical protein
MEKKNGDTEKSRKQYLALTPTPPGKEGGENPKVQPQGKPSSPGDHRLTGVTTTDTRGNTISREP